MLYRQYQRPLIPMRETIEQIMIKNTIRDMRPMKKTLHHRD